MPRIGHIALNVSDFNCSEAFYDRLLFPIGFQSDHREEDHKGAAKSYRSGEHNLWIKWDAAKIHAPFVRDVGLDHLAFYVDSKQRVDAAFGNLKSIGTQITIAPKYYPEYSDTYYAFYFRDPDGVPLEIAVV